MDDDSHRETLVRRIPLRCLGFAMSPHTHIHLLTEWEKDYWNISTGISLDDDTDRAPWYSIDEPAHHSTPCCHSNNVRPFDKSGGSEGRVVIGDTFWMWTLLLSRLFFLLNQCYSVGPRCCTINNEIKNSSRKLEDKGWWGWHPLFPVRNEWPGCREEQRTLQWFSSWYGATAQKPLLLWRACLCVYVVCCWILWQSTVSI